jgi:hypothetical protein
MTDRYTRTDADKALIRLADALGKPIGSYRALEDGEVSNFSSATHSTVPGGWHLDVNATYGGCVIHEMGPAGETYIREPFGSTRRTYRDFCDAVNFALNAHSLANT